MFLFSRQTRLAPGNGTEGIEWATGMAGTVKSITGQEVQLWATIHSPGFGTIGWTSWFEDLASLEAMGDKLLADPGYLKMANDGAKFIEGTIDDAIARPLYGSVDPERNLAYVAGVSCVVAPGSYERAMAAGVSISKKFEEITGLSSMFLSSLTGPYGTIGFLSGYESISEFQAAQDAIAADTSFVKLVDSTKGCFIEDPSVTPATLYRRIA